MDLMADLLAKPAFKIFNLEAAICVTKSMLLSVGIITTVFFVKVAIIPKTASLLITTLPRFWVSFKFWLSPPYVFIIFNIIIITIAASSTLRRQSQRQTPDIHSTSQEDDTHLNVYEDQNFSTEMIWDGMWQLDEQDHKEEERQGRNSMKWDSSTLLIDPLPEKLCAYSGEKMEDENGGDTLDATWKAIMENKQNQTPQLRKCETWDSPAPPRINRFGADVEEDPLAWVRNEVRKSDIFKETLSFRRKKSMSHEELKRRAEAFIKMVNDSIRLQRQESEQRCLQTVQRSF